MKKMSYAQKCAGHSGAADVLNDIVPCGITYSITAFCPAVKKKPHKNVITAQALKNFASTRVSVCFRLFPDRHCRTVWFAAGSNPGALSCLLFELPAVFLVCADCTMQGAFRGADGWANRLIAYAATRGATAVFQASAGTSSCRGVKAAHGANVGANRGLRRPL